MLKRLARENVRDRGCKRHLVWFFGSRSSLWILYRAGVGHVMLTVPLNNLLKNRTRLKITAMDLVSELWEDR